MHPEVKASPPAGAVRTVQWAIARVRRSSSSSSDRTHEKPKMASFLPETVLNMEATILVAKRRFCQSFILMTLSQYAATSKRR